MSRRRKLWLLAGLIAVLGCVVMRFSVPAPKPVQVVVDASRLPATASAFGSRIRLVRLSKGPKPNNVVAEIRVTRGKGRRNVPVEVSTYPSCAPARSLLVEGESDGSYAEAVFDLPPGTRSVDIAQRVHRIARPSPKVFKLTVTPTSRLPLAVSSPGTTVTLERAYIGRPGDIRSGWFAHTPTCTKAPPGRHLIVQLGIRNDGDPEFHGRVEIRRGPFFAPDPEMDEAHYTALSDLGMGIVATSNRGRAVSWSAVKSDESGGRGDAFYREACRETTLGRALQVVSPRAASWEATTRANRAAKGAGYACQVQCAYPIGKVNPRSFALSIPVTLPPAPRDRATIVFRNVPVPPP